MDELNEMRRQMAAMKESLDKSQIVSKKLMMKIMKGKATALNRIVFWECVSLPFLFLMILGLCYIFHSSFWVAWCFLLLATADTLADFKTIRIGARKMSEYTLIELKQFIVRQKKLRRIQTIISSVVVILWLIWAYYEWFHLGNLFNFNDDVFNIAFSIIVGVSVIAALIVVIVIMKKLDNINDEMVADIDEYTE
ncbi:MAG: hypothetical protein K2M07_08160 [Muribaculaceae bacterium]|nr:hypothetical protein [Muribaculaceae bacterium]